MIEPTLVERLRRLGSDSGDEYDWEVCGRGADRIEALEAALEKATEAIIMMSGSSDFSTDGQAGKWWAKFRDETFYPEIMSLTGSRQ